MASEAGTQITNPLRPVKIDAERAPPFYPDDQPLIAFQLSYDEMVLRFGPSHRVMDENDNEPGPCEYWSFAFPCGLTIFIAFHLDAPTGPSGNVHASSRDIGHILEHMPVVTVYFGVSTQPNLTSPANSSETLLPRASGLPNRVLN